ncbi:hypothetical protein DFAR_2690039 [Desulfarculales bacterium]
MSASGGPAKGELRGSKTLFQRAFQSGPICLILSVLPEGVVLDVNEIFLLMTGYSREEIIGCTALKMGYYPDPALRQMLVERLMVSGSLRGLRLDLRRKDG